MTTKPYNIEQTRMHDAYHWQRIGRAGDHLASILDDMAAVVRLSMDSATDDDLKRLDIVGDPNGTGLGPDAAVEWCDTWALELRYAYWMQSDGGHGDLSRAWFLLGCGGPHIELNVLCDRNGEVERVTLERRWSESDSAWTTDHKACVIVRHFLYVVGINAG